jgi:hypothetical protein
MPNVVPLYALRPSSEVVAELTWYFQRSASEMGMGSSWESLSYLARSGCAHSSASPEERMTERRVEAARRHRWVHVPLLQIPVSLQLVLELHYDERKLPPQLSLSSSIALVSTRSPLCRASYREAAAKARAHEDSILTWLTGLCIRAKDHAADSTLLADIQLESEMLSGAAHRAFAAGYVTKAQREALNAARVAR